MATKATPMTLDGFVVEATDERRPDEQRQNGNEPPAYSMVQEPVPIVMPEPHVEQALISESMPVPQPSDPIKAFPSGPVSQVVQEKPKSSKDHSGSSDASHFDDEKEKHEHKHGHTHEQHLRKKASDIDHEYKHDEVVSTDPVLSRDAKALADFIRLHGMTHPSFSVHLLGTHEEIRTRVVTNSDGKGSHVETYVVTVTDFSFSIDLSDVFDDKDAPVLYTLSDDVPAYRGGMTMAIETGGARPIEQRTLVHRSEQNEQKDANDAGRQLGQPPWLIRPKATTHDEEARMGTTPQLSSRTFEEWLEDYIRSRRVVKEFKFFKEIYTWNLDALEIAILQLIRSTGYDTSVTIKFKVTPDCVHVFSPNRISKIFSSYLLIFLTSIILVFPFLWMWRRWWPGAGGKWEVCGAAFRVKRWELLPGTSPGETEQAAIERLGGEMPWGIGLRRIKAGREGVWVLKGVHEGDWLRMWDESIRYGVIHEQKCAWLKRRSDVLTNSEIACGLDHL